MCNRKGNLEVNDLSTIKHFPLKTLCLEVKSWGPVTCFIFHFNSRNKSQTPITKFACLLTVDQYIFIVTDFSTVFQNSMKWNNY